MTLMRTPFSESKIWVGVLPQVEQPNTRQTSQDKLRIRRVVLDLPWWNQQYWCPDTSYPQDVRDSRGLLYFA